MNDTLDLRETLRLKRDQYSIACIRCNGYCDWIDLTMEEIKAQRCGRNYSCCTRAFKCRLCNQRILADLDAP